MKEILENYVNTNTSEEYSMALMEALKASHDSDELKNLINTLTNISGEKALHVAARNGHESVARLLIERGADLNTPSKYGQAAIHLAVLSGNVETVKVLLEKGAEINKEDDGETALYKAAYNGQKAIVRLLLLCGGKLGGIVSDIGEIVKEAQSENDKIAIAERALSAESIGQDSLLNPQNGFVVADVLGLVKLFMNNNISPTTLPVEHASRLAEQRAKTAADAARGI